MAAFLPILGDLSGSIGDNTFARNGKSSYVRRRTKPVNTITARRSAVRQAFQLASDEWRDTVTNPGKTSWDAYATNTPVPGKFGLPRTRTGRDWFMAINTFLLNAGSPIQSAPPATPGLAKAYTPTATADTSDGIQIVTIAPPLDSNDIVQVQISAPYANTRLKFNGNPVITQFYAGDVVEGTTLVPGSELAIGQVFFILTTIHDEFGKIQITPNQMRVEVTA